ncbi:SurA N-terminal domain-containing protein [Limibacillus halophilus]|uniref:Parvulin-like PPIase n=1 Tax=Limibacillus halophilus TaxID=1579333 RepID=A0A839SY73_9PROT|nr:SurA N-terminal domain-containing protein [Limibacillus halophilus]MBB3065903.1 peptidyl-prolyl cis-trans isomerase D [Limibacillus halophilus]
MLMKMRSKGAKFVTFILFGLLILSFVVWGIGDIFRTVGVDTTVVTVGDREVTQQEFATNLQQEVRRTQQALGRTIGQEEIQTFGLAKRALDRIVTQAVFDSLADDLGMAVSEAQIEERLRNDPNFKGPDGKFDPNIVRSALRANNLSESGFVRSLSDGTKRQQVLDSSMSAVKLPGFVAERLFAYEEEKRVGRYVVVYNNSFVDVPDPDEVTLQSYYNDNKQSFLSPEYRSATIIRFTAEDLVDEVSVTEEALLAAYEERREEFNDPEKRSITQLVVPDNETADKVLALVENGKTLEEAATELAVGTPVTLGEIVPGELPENLEKTAYALRNGEVGGPAESPLGFHIVRVDNIVPGVQRGFEEVRDQVERDLRLREAVDTLVSIANSLDDTLASGASLEDAARDLNLPIESFDAIDRFGRDRDQEPIAFLEPRNRIVGTVFETNANEESIVTDTGDNGYYVVRVNGITPQAEQPLDAVREQVLRAWKRQERERLAEELAKAIVAKVQEGVTLDAAIKAVDAPDTANLAVEETSPVKRDERSGEKVPSPQFTRSLFALAPGDTETTQGQLSQIVVQLKEVIPADPQSGTADLEAIEAATAIDMEGDLFVQLMGALRQHYGVSVNQQQVNQLLSNYF